MKLGRDRRATAASRDELARWIALSPGRELLALESQALAELLPDLFGYYLIQVGQLGSSDLLATSRVRSRTIIELEDGNGPGPGYPVLRASAQAVPLAADSIDVAILPHVLEFEDNPHQVLREVERFLVPEGHLVILGFNPWSTMGLWKIVRFGRGQAPWGGHWVGLTRLRDWLALLGFEVVKVSAHFHRLPLRNTRALERMRGLDRLGDKFAPGLGGAYLVLARKRVTTLTPIKPRWRPRRSLVAGGLEPTVRRINGR